jgi:hypothetical protein
MKKTVHDRPAWQWRAGGVDADADFERRVAALANPSSFPVQVDSVQVVRTAGAALDGRPGFVSRATCLRESAGDVSLEEVTRALLAALSGRITQLCAEGPEGLQRDYLARAGVVGREGSLFPEFADSPDKASPLASGRIVAVHPDLSLEVAGHTGRFQSGRLLLIGGGEPSD